MVCCLAEKPLYAKELDRLGLLRERTLFVRHVGVSVRHCQFVSNVGLISTIGRVPHDKITANPSAAGLFGRLHHRRFVDAATSR